MDDNDMSGTPPDNAEIGNSTSSDSSNGSSTHCIFSTPPEAVSIIISQGNKSPIEIRDGPQVHPVTQIGNNNQGEHNKGFTSDNGSSNGMKPPREILTGSEQCPHNNSSDIIVFPSIIPAMTNYPNHIGRHPPWIPTVIEPIADGSKRLDSNCNVRRIKTVVLVVLICLAVSAVVVVIVVNKNVDDADPIPITITPDFLTGKCNNQESVVSPGDRICIPYDDLYKTSRISHITIQQTSSAYSYDLFQFNMSVNSTVSNFTRYVHDWIVDYNISRTDQMLRLVQPKAYCSSSGKYSVILIYYDGSNTSFEFEVRMRDPQVHQMITFDDQELHVHCELTGTCLPSSLAIYVNVDNSTYLVPDTNACSYNDKETGTMVSIQATIPSSMFTKYQSISCVPLMRNQELAENLTSTIPVCHGIKCKPNCKDASATNIYYPHSVYCDKYYQCSNGEAIEKPCSDGTYWEPAICTCASYNTTICDTNIRITPLRTLTPCG